MNFAGLSPEETEMSWLDDLCAAQWARIVERKRLKPPGRVLAEVGLLPAARDLPASLLRFSSRSRGVPAVIAEIKFASPSRGEIRQSRDVEAVARSYEAAGAAALSVLTAEEHFGGSLSYLARAREACALPLLCKDFLLDSYQVLEARSAGADAVLLIARLLDRATISEMLGVATDLGMAALLEVHEAPDLEKIAGLPVKLLGVNHRNLDTLQMDPALSARLAPRLPADTVRVAESGLSTGADLSRMAALGYDAVLIGSGFMRADDPGEALSRLLEETHAAR
jgi:indole-3-glycerol phosphate synthase